MILDSIPNSVPSRHLTPFLSDDFLPPVFCRIPESIDIVAEWLVNRIYQLEIMEKNLWPENGKELINMFLVIIRSLYAKGERGEISFSTSLAG
ncbi:Kinetochore-associated protein 1, partial [Stegodyphus mimosarum]